MKKLFKVLSGALVTSMVVALMALPTVAAGTNYTAVAAQNVTFSKYLLVEADANLPGVTFSYTASSSEVTEIAATATTLPVYAGAGTPTVADITYAGNETAEATTLLAGYDTYKKTIEVDFANITYTEPGVHRYYIIETDSSLAGMYCDVEPTDATTLKTEGDRYRTLDVYVEDNTTSTGKNLIVTGFVMYDGKIEAAPKSADSATAGTAITSTTPITVSANNNNEPDGAEKTDRFVNFYESFEITFGKEVTGNQGSRDKYFKYTLTLTSPVAATFDVDISNADSQVPSNAATNSTYVGQSNPTSITVSANSASNTVFYLQDGQYITVKGVPAGTAYTLAEDEEGYTKTEGITAALSSLDWNATVAGNDALTDAVQGSITNADIHTGFTNDKQGIIPTGILMKVGPIIAVGVIVVAGAAFFMVRSMRRKVLEGNDAEETEE